MELFYIVTTAIAVIILILALTFIGLMIQNGKNTQTFPPNTSQCPDMWIADGSYCHFNGVNYGNYMSTPTGVNSDSGIFLTDTAGYIYDFTQTTKSSPAYPTDSNGNKLNAFPTTSPPYFTYGGTTNLNTTTINPFDQQWTSGGLSAVCSQKQWANANNIQWSGVSQSNTC